MKKILFLVFVFSSIASFGQPIILSTKTINGKEVLQFKKGNTGVAKPASFTSTSEIPNGAGYQTANDVKAVTDPISASVATHTGQIAANTSAIKITRDSVNLVVGGVRYRGANLVPKPTDTGNGNFQVRACFYDTWGAGWDWDGWIKPQIDAMASIGINAIRMQGDFLVRYATASSSFSGAATFVYSGTISAATYASRLDQVITYCASKGMSFYACGGDFNFVNSSFTLSQINAYLAEYVNVVSNPAYTNVIGIDLCQEVDGGSGWSAQVLSNAPAIITNAKAALRKNLPVTFSLNGASNAAGLNPATRGVFTNIATSGADYLDVHLYYTPGPGDILPAVNNPWGLPLIVGEIGINYNGSQDFSAAQETTHPYSSEKRIIFWDAVVNNIATVSGVKGTIVWASVKEWPTDAQDWGLFGSAQDPTTKAFTDPRTASIARVQKFPVSGGGGLGVEYNKLGALGNTLRSGVASPQQTIVGSTLSGGGLLLRSTTHATKGKVILDSLNNVVVDQATGYIGVGVAPSGTNVIDIKKSIAGGTGTMNVRLWNTSSLSAYAQFYLKSDISEFVAGIGGTGSAPFGAGAGAGYLDVKTNHSLILGTNDAARMTILGGGSIGVGTVAPSAKALMEYSSTTKYILLPRMTTTQRDAISSPEEGAEIYNLTSHAKEYWNGTAWKTVTTN